MLRNRKEQLLRSAYMTELRNEAHVTNYMARQIIESQENSQLINLWRLSDDCQNFSGVYSLPLCHKHALDLPGFACPNFVLHLHRFHNYQPLASLDFFTRFCENAHNFSGHRGQYLLPAFCFNRGAVSPAPQARIVHSHKIFFARDMNL